MRRDSYLAPTKKCSDLELRILMPKRLPNLFRSICYGIFAVAITAAPQVDAAGQLVAFEVAARGGLQRAWYAQVRVDRASSRVLSWALHDQHLFALTSAGTVHTLDSETGETLWVARVGTPGHPIAGPAVNANFVAVLGGSRLYLLDRGDGHVVWSRSVGSAAVAAPALSANYAYVGMLNGRMEGYRLDSPANGAWQYQSAGHIFQAPTITGDFVTWATDRGHLYVSNAIRPRVLFRVETQSEFDSAPTAQNGNFYAASLDGYLSCYSESTGNERWRYSMGLPITRTPAVIGDKVYVASEAPELSAVDSKSGRHLWTTLGTTQFVAQGANRVYGVDRHGALLILESASGAILGRIANGEGISALINDQSDRIFLVSDAGLVQCLHEMGATQPTYYRKSPNEADLPAEEPADDSTEAAPEEASTEDADIFDDSSPF